MSSQRKILTVLAIIIIVVAIGAIYAWHKGNVNMAAADASAPMIEPSVTTIISPSTNPANLVSNTTFDIVSPSTQPPAVTVSEPMPGSSGY